jgi:hypothetical protein
MKQTRINELKETAWLLDYIFHSGCFMTPRHTKYFETKERMEEWKAKFKETIGAKSLKVWSEGLASEAVSQWRNHELAELKRIDEPDYFDEGLDKKFYFRN